MANYGNPEDINRLNELCERLSKLVAMLRKYGIEAGEAENEYKKALTVEALRLKSEGMAITLIDKVVYGLDAVAEARLKRDTAIASYDALKENINTTKVLIRVLENQINREWQLL